MMRRRIRGAPPEGGPRPRGPLDWVDRGLRLLSMACLSGIVLVVLHGVVSRFVFGNPSRWAIDVASLLMIPLTYIATASIARDDRHVAVTLFVSSKPGGAARYLRMGALLLQIAATAIATVAAWFGFLRMVETGQLSVTAGLPMWPFAIAAPLGLGLLVVVFVAQLVSLVRRGTTLESER